MGRSIPRRQNELQMNCWRLLEIDIALRYAPGNHGGSVMRRALILLAATLLLSASTVSLNAQTPDSSSPGLVCNGGPRECLDYMLNVYLKALVAHKPEALPVAANVKFTENGVDRKLGEGLWQTITGFNVTEGGTKLEYIDLPQKTAGLHMIAMEGNSPAVFILRIKVIDRKIAEVETHVIRNQQGVAAFDPGGLHGFSSPMSMTPKQPQLNSREEMTRISERYLEALKTGNFNAADSPIAADAYRMENGRLTATSQIPPQPALTHRIEAVDEDLGLVWVREDLGSRVAWEGIKIFDGRIHAIEGFSGS